MFHYSTEWEAYHSITHSKEKDGREGPKGKLHTQKGKMGGKGRKRNYKLKKRKRKVSAKRKTTHSIERGSGETLHALEKGDGAFEKTS